MTCLVFCCYWSYVPKQYVILVLQFPATVFCSFFLKLIFDISTWKLLDHEKKILSRKMHLMRNWHNPDLFFLCNTKQNTQHLRGIFLDFFMFFVQHCFICCPLDSSVSEDAGIEPRIVATLALPARRSNHIG